MKKYIKRNSDTFVSSGHIGNTNFCHYSRDLRKIKDYVICNVDYYEMSSYSEKKEILFRKGFKYKIKYRFKIISLTESGYIKNEKKYILVKSDSKKERLIMEIDVIDKDMGKLTYGKHLLIEKI
jgi:hypothetical protein